jgi:hypothetical protein
MTKLVKKLSYIASFVHISFATNEEVICIHQRVNWGAVWSKRNTS